MTDTIRKVAWIHIADRRLLCVRTAGRGLFYVPGGKPEAREDDASALRREILEELGVALSTLVLIGRFVAEADGGSGKTVAIDAYHADHSGALAMGAEIAEIRFLASADAALASAATRRILDHLKAGNLID